MPKSENQKMKILYLMDMLLKETDANHKLTVNQMIARLESNHGIKVERKTLYADLELLRDFGLDIQKDKTKTHNYYIEKRAFELSELKIMVDVIQSSRFITAKKSGEFIDKIESLTSSHLARNLHRQVYVNRQIKTMNESIYSNVDKIHEAILENRKISFQYYEYTLKKEKQYRKKGKVYFGSPLFMIWDSENYYLVSYCSESCIVKHYRVDKMINIKIVDEKPETPPIEIDPSTYTHKIFSMFSGEEYAVELEFDASLIDVVIDRFGNEVTIIQKSEKSFVVHVKVEISPVFLGWIFQFGTKIRVLSPSFLIETIKERASSLLMQYE